MPYFYMLPQLTHVIVDFLYLYICHVRFAQANARPHLASNKDNRRQSVFVDWRKKVCTYTNLSKWQALIPQPPLVSSNLCTAQKNEIKYLLYQAHAKTSIKYLMKATVSDKRHMKHRREGGNTGGANFNKGIAKY